jgi:valyl-tRNA synthetase
MITLHPFMPFITEELYQEVCDANAPFQSICNVQLTDSESLNSAILDQGELLIELTTAIREIRAKNQIKPKDDIRLFHNNSDQNHLSAIEQTLIRLNYISALAYADKAENTTPLTIKGVTYYMEAKREVDPIAEAVRLEQELAYTIGFLDSVMKKLSNERFVANAKADVIDRERQKASDAERKIMALREELERLGAKK